MAAERPSPSFSFASGRPAAFPCRKSGEAGQEKHNAQDVEVSVAAGMGGRSDAIFFLFRFICCCLLGKDKMLN